MEKIELATLLDSRFSILEAAIGAHAAAYASATDSALLYRVCLSFMYALMTIVGPTKPFPNRTVAVMIGVSNAITDSCMFSTNTNSIAALIARHCRAGSPLPQTQCGPRPGLVARPAASGQEPHSQEQYGGSVAYHSHSKPLHRSALATVGPRLAFSARRQAAA